jgi:hypothetical protein
VTLTLAIEQLAGIGALGLLVGYFAGCMRAAYVDSRRKGGI